jgi:uncharacterized membrane protein YkvA (DUF1232 family)
MPQGGVIMRPKLGKKIFESFVFAKMKNIAIKYLKSPKKLSGLIDKAKSKAQSINQESLKEIWNSLMGFFRLIFIHAKGEYSEIPWQSLILIVATILYFLIPIDVIPDFIGGLGYIDDVALIAWVANVVKPDIDKFLEWESKRC